MRALLRVQPGKEKEFVDEVMSKKLILARLITR